MDLNLLLGNSISSIVEKVGGIIDNLTTTIEEKDKAKLQASELVNKSISELLELQTEVLKTEMQGNFLQRSWRPLMMLTFLIFLGSYWFGYSKLPDNIAFELFDLIKLGLGGYVIGRSVEKVAENVSRMDFGKK